jgi:NADH dehydrogenase
LLGFRNRVSVFVNWVWNYFTYDRAARVIMEYPNEEVAETSNSERMAS